MDRVYLRQRIICSLNKKKLFVIKGQTVGRISRTHNIGFHLTGIPVQLFYQSILQLAA